MKEPLNDNWTAFHTFLSGYWNQMADEIYASFSELQRAISCISASPPSLRRSVLPGVFFLSRAFDPHSVILSGRDTAG